MGSVKQYSQYDGVLIQVFWEQLSLMVPFCNDVHMRKGQRQLSQWSCCQTEQNR